MSRRDLWLDLLTSSHSADMAGGFTLSSARALPVMHAPATTLLLRSIDSAVPTHADVRSRWADEYHPVRPSHGSGRRGRRFVDRLRTIMAFVAPTAASLPAIDMTHVGVRSDSARGDDAERRYVGLVVL